MQLLNINHHVRSVNVLCNYRVDSCDFSTKVTCAFLLLENVLIIEIKLSEKNDDIFHISDQI